MNKTCLWLLVALAIVVILFLLFGGILSQTLNKKVNEFSASGTAVDTAGGLLALFNRK